MLSFILSFVVFVGSSTNADEACPWRKLYGKNYLDSRTPKLRPVSRVRLSLETNERYIFLYNKGKLSVAEKAEKAALEAGYRNRHAELLGLEAQAKEHKGQKTQKPNTREFSDAQRVELAAYEATDGNVEAARLALRYKELNAIERARYEALIKTRGDFRAAYLAEQKARGNLNNKIESAEFNALMMSNGDKRYADLKRDQAMGNRQGTCDLQEMAFIESAIAPQPMNQAVKADRLRAPAVIESIKHDGQNAEAVDENNL